MRLHHALLTSAVLATAAAPAIAGFSLGNSTTGYFDGSSGTRSVTVTGAEPGFGSTVTDLNIRIDFEKFDGQTFGVNNGGAPFYNEIEFILTSPDNQSVVLIAQGSFQSVGGAQGFRGVINFDQQAATAVNANPAAVQAGTFRPVGDLNTFNGVATTGTWTLFIRDANFADHLGFYAMILDFNGGGETTSNVPEPSPLMLGLLALGGLPAARRLRRKA